MKNSFKGALLSGLVFPGLGQIVLKHHKSGVLLIFTFLVNLSIAVVEAVRAALAVLEKLQMAGGAMDLAAISDVATRVTTGVGTFKFNFALLLAFLCWVLGIVDAYIIGKKKDRADAVFKPAP